MRERPLSVEEKDSAWAREGDNPALRPMVEPRTNFPGMTEERLVLAKIVCVEGPVLRALVMCERGARTRREWIPIEQDGWIVARAEPGSEDPEGEGRVTLNRSKIFLIEVIDENPKV